MNPFKFFRDADARQSIVESDINLAETDEPDPETDIASQNTIIDIEESADDKKNV